jgi:hypothetical protein
VPVYADPVDGLAVPVPLLQTWTAGLVEHPDVPFPGAHLAAMAIARLDDA